ncbi:hypothetical protein BOTBODRAFT_55536 [Botryobasidium botryosum FD-172 SS1]|uniref:Uncharacterized protein n=1 Tax=Botryobasidium botryosum (strain FD-172 SS1) TaxID=930990 RepID=A0A067MI59_BOTB1|nr:hypothetical protein BOTBODRAFT_55536 [Botryobasidium botryosum FD-172 SS1]
MAANTKLHRGAIYWGTSVEISDTIAPLPSDTFFPHPTVTSSSSIAYSGPGDGVIPVNYPAQYGGAAFAASSVDMGPSFGPHFPVAIAGASFLASQPIPRPLVESSNLSSLCRVASMGKGFTYLGPPPPRPPHPLRFLFDEVRVYAPVMQRNLLTINSGCPIIPGEVAAPATNDSPEPHNPHLNIDTALVLDIEAELRQIFGNFEDTGKVMWSGAGGA